MTTQVSFPLEGFLMLSVIPLPVESFHLLLQLPPSLHHLEEELHEVQLHLVELELEEVATDFLQLRSSPM